MTSQRASVDVQDLRDRHPLPDVMADAGIELIPRGGAWMACCPFHEDRTASMSVEGVPDRFHCFGCGASGDVIDFVQRTRNLDFLDAVAELENGRSIPVSGIAANHPRLRSVPAPPDFQVTHERAFEINQLAWDHLSTPVAASFARQRLWHHRGLNLRDLQLEAPGPLVGYASHGWTTLTEHLRGEGVTDDELLELDLATRTRTGGLIDTLRDRLIFPVTNSHGQIHGFIGRDVSGHPHAPKYRNPAGPPSSTSPSCSTDRRTTPSLPAVTPSSSKAPSTPSPWLPLPRPPASPTRSPR